MIKKKDLEGFTRDELLEKRAELMDKRDQIKDQIDQAESITVYDPEWYRRAKYALKCTRKDIQTVECEISVVNLQDRTNQIGEAQQEAAYWRKVAKRLKGVVGEDVYNRIIDTLDGPLPPGFDVKELLWNTPPYTGNFTPQSGPLDGQTWVVTGRFERFSRDQMKFMLQDLGARMAGAVGEHTTRVVAGPGGVQSKLLKARQYNIPVMGEEEFIQLMHHHGV